MTKTLRARTALVFLPVIFLSLMATREVRAQNSVPNPGFEQSEWGWPWPWWAGETWSYDSQVSHSGGRSLKVTYPDRETYDLAGQQINITAGEFYQVGAWIKTQGVTAPGASICIEWFHNGQWLGGEWGFQKVTATTPWQFISLPSVSPPELATKANIYLVMAKGSTGAAWYDDAVVIKRQEPALSFFILRPNYAGKILPDSPSPQIKVEAAINSQELDVPLGTLKIVATLKNKKGDTIVQKDFDSLSSHQVTISLDLPADAPAGVYDLALLLFSKVSGSCLAQKGYSLDKLSRQRFSALTSYIDAHNRFILNGEPFFPIGLYMGDDYRWDYSQVDEVADSPFDTVMNYGINVGNPDQIARYLDHLHEKNLKLIYSLKDYLGQGRADLDTITRKVNAYKDHPAVISWYLNDESGPEYLPELEARYRKVRELDENHPVWSVHCQKGALIAEGHTTDISGVDPYPIPAQPITLVSEMADWAKEAGRGYRPFWLVPQIFDPNNYNRHPSRLPTPQEMRAMTYLATNHEARGIIYYSYFDIRFADYYKTQWAAVRQIASQIKSLRSVFLSTEMVSDTGITCSNSSIDCKLMKEDHTYYLFAVNTLNRKIEAVPFQNNLTCKPSIIHVLFEKDRKIAASKGNFTDNFLPYEVHAYEFSI